MNNAGRIALVVTGAITALLATALVLGGSLALYGEIEKDDDGYLMTDAHRLSGDTRALSTGNLDVDLGEGDWVVRPDDLGKLRLDAESRDGKELFVGIAATSDVERYLNGVPHTTVRDLDYEPFGVFDDFEADYRTTAGKARAGKPGDETFWAASASGTGVQDLTWDVRDGDWSVVVMNADGSPGVQAGVSAGAKLPILDELGWTAIGGGVLFVVITGGLVALATRRRPDTTHPTAATRVMPAA